jgi:hypothetical protein
MPSPSTSIRRGFESGAMCTQWIRNLEFLQLVRGTIQLLLGHGKRCNPPTTA